MTKQRTLIDKGNNNNWQNWKRQLQITELYMVLEENTLEKRHRGSYMNAHVLLNLLNKLAKRDKMRVFYLFFATSVINSIIREHEC